MLDNDFSKSDPKDALLIADNAQKGSYTFYKTFENHSRLNGERPSGPNALLLLARVDAQNEIPRECLPVDVIISA